MRNASLDGVRGAAAIFVVLYHMHLALPGLGVATNGYLAVDLFFALSGFVICSAYGAHLSSTDQWRSFIIRRFGRLWPTHVATTILYYAVIYAVLAACILAHIPKASLARPSSGDLVGMALMIQGLNTFNHPVGTGVAWSTSDEFYVYVLFGALCLLLRGRARVAAFTMLALVGYALAIWASVGPHACLAKGRCFDLTYSYGWTRCLVGFFAGALIAEYRDRSIVRALTGGGPQVLTFTAALLFVLFAGGVPRISLAAPVVFAVLIGSLTSDSGPVARLFHVRATQYLGKISYSLYLGHAVLWPLLGILRPVATGAIFLFMTLALAHLLHCFVETPWRERFNAWAETASRPRANSSSSAQAT
jgi:peptidoglycan/LPS O-acetylase OafA/YrhL